MSKSLSLRLGSMLLAASVGSVDARALECSFVAPPEGQLADLSVPLGARNSGVARDKSFKADRPPEHPTSVALATVGGRPHLDVDGFISELDATLRNAVAGFEMQLRQNGVVLRNKDWQWAKRPADGSLAWQDAQPMHVASLSKLITAMAVVKLLDETKIPHNAKIASYLPAHWTAGPNVDQITFADLLTHRSGFLIGQDGCEDNSYADYQFIKARVAKGVTSTGQFCYANMNFGLLRVLISIINGDVDRNATISEQEWDDRTLQAYQAYISRAIFAPARVANATLDRPANNALAYQYPPVDAGYDTGKLGCLAGAAGWNMTVHEMLDVMSTFRRGNTIISPDAAQKMLDSTYGINSIDRARTGNIYVRIGWWRYEDDDGKVWMEQSLALFLPEGMELVIFANSPMAGRGSPLVLNAVEAALEKHIKLN